ncbi:MAG: hypothetical protein RL138_804 [Bacteroidota bacterium]|jgi:hypothetical protein|nr:hypothetical protein [Chitinophagales bacterium]
MIRLLTFILPAVVVALAAILTTWIVLKQLLKAKTTDLELEIKKNTRQTTLPLRLQAYERLTLFMERIDLFFLVSELRAANMSVAELQLMMCNQIRREFEHNLSQQLYVSDELWVRVRTTKEEMILLVNSIAVKLPPQAPAKAYAQAIMEFLNEADGVMPTAKTLIAIKAEARQIF